MDVPCSGTGVIKRQPDTKWKLTEDQLEDLITTQRAILGNYLEMLKPGGDLIYATCSIFKSENEDQTLWFLENFPSYTLVEEIRIDPSSTEDGFYMAKFQNKERQTDKIDS